MPGEKPSAVEAIGLDVWFDAEGMKQTYNEPAEMEGLKDLFTAKPDDGDLPEARRPVGGVVGVSVPPKGWSCRNLVPSPRTFTGTGPKVRGGADRGTAPHPTLSPPRGESEKSRPRSQQAAAPCEPISELPRESGGPDV